nr:MAG TPA: hypothetical protein [Caudoviricetes sp.]
MLLLKFLSITYYTLFFQKVNPLIYQLFYLSN